jgi:hypothetical protein
MEDDVHYRAHKNPPLVHVLSQMASVHMPHSYKRRESIVGFYWTVCVINGKSTEVVDIWESWFKWTSLFASGKSVFHSWTPVT